MKGASIGFTPVPFERGGTALVLMVCLLASCKRTTRPEASPGAAGESSTTVTIPANAMGITTAKVELEEVADYLEAPAKIEPDPVRVVHVFPVVGGRLMSVAVRPGDQVQTGQVLARLESSEAAAALADYRKAQADMAWREQQLQREQELLAHGAAAQKDYQQAQADLRIAEATLASAVARLHLLGVDPSNPSDQIQVKAPRSGVVLDIGAAPGELSKATDAPQPLCTLADLTEVWAGGEIFEKDLASLHVGQPAEVEVNAYPGRKWSGRVAKVGYAVDPAMRAVKLRVVLNNPGLLLRPEMFATMHILRAKRMAPVVPASAVVQRGASAYVFVQKAPGRFERRPVTVRPAAEGKVEITSGLQAGEVVAAQGSLLLGAAGT